MGARRRGYGLRGTEGSRDTGAAGGGTVARADGRCTMASVMDPSQAPEVDPLALEMNRAGRMTKLQADRLRAEAREAGDGCILIPLVVLLLGLGVFGLLNPDGSIHSPVELMLMCTGIAAVPLLILLRDSRRAARLKREADGGIVVFTDGLLSKEMSPFRKWFRLHVGELQFYTSKDVYDAAAEGVPHRAYHPRGFPILLAIEPLPPG